MFLFGIFLSKFIKTGQLVVIDAHGRLHRFGPGESDTDPVTIVLSDPALHWKLALHPSLYLGEAYMDGTLTMARGSMSDLLELCGKNTTLRGVQRRRFWGRVLIQVMHRLTQWNSLSRSRRNVAHHYDLAQDLYKSFLDSDMQYSCAYFPLPHATLDEAQKAKREHIAAKLLLKRNQKVLDIGCGWGGLAIDLARRADVRVDGVTLSPEQLQFAKERAEAAGMNHGVHFELRDYRNLNGTYDRIVSVGMFEHVGAPYYHPFFRKLHDLLTPDGVALIHSIGSMDGPGFGNSWIRKYIFPGGYAPALSEVLPAAEASGLIVTDIEILRLHYAQTLKLWRERFLQNWDAISHLYDDRFKRMWDFYLVASEMAFRYGGLMVFQIQLAKNQHTVPLTRDYISDFEQSAAQQPSKTQERAA
ncbi:MAG: cyclopropane-fatty-acyl-phospholipid synthase family protein [Rhizomicrobium sp.]